MITELDEAKQVSTKRNKNLNKRNNTLLSKLKVNTSKTIYSINLELLTQIIMDNFYVTFSWYLVFFSPKTAWP